MRKLITCLVLCCCGIAVFGQTIRFPVSATYTRLAAYSSRQSDVLSFANQAALASLQKFTAGVYGERRFLLEDLGVYQLAAALPTAFGNFGWQMSYNGSPVYNESHIGLAYARTLGPVDIGAQFNYHAIGAGGYGKAAGVTMEAGIIFRVTDAVRTGIHVYNPTGEGLMKTEEVLPVIYSAGIGYDVSEFFFAALEIQKAEALPVNVNAGLQYIFHKKLLARAGISTAATGFYFGAGVVLDQFRLDITVAAHPVLGISPGLALIYKSREK
jgi:hypothetical protein